MSISRCEENILSKWLERHVFLLDTYNLKRTVYTSTIKWLERRVSLLDTYHLKRTVYTSTIKWLERRVSLLDTYHLKRTVYTQSVVLYNILGSNEKMAVNIFMVNSTQNAIKRINSICIMFYDLLSRYVSIYRYIMLWVYDSRQNDSDDRRVL